MTQRSILFAATLLIVGMLPTAFADEKAAAPIEKQVEKKTEPRRSFERGAVKTSIKLGLNWLKEQQNRDGSYGFKIPIGKDKVKEIGDVGITSLVVLSMATSPMQLRPGHGPFVSNAVDYLLANVNDDGSIANPEGGLKNYKTSIAVLALAAINDEGDYDRVIADAREFIVGLQASEETGYDPKKHPRAYGGIGYGGDLRPDMSNSWVALDALRAAGLDKDSPVWARAVRFIARTQNLAPYNDFDQGRKNIVILSDGSFRYAPDETKVIYEPLTGKNKGKRIYPGYQSMTYAGLLSFIHADVDKGDPRVQAAVRWIAENFSVDENSGLGTRANPTGGAEGLYYCRFVMAKALDAYGEPLITTRAGAKHNWAWELSKRLVQQQHEDGWWVNARSDRWWENNPTLVTCYATLSLNRCYTNLNAQVKQVKQLKAELVETEKELVAAKAKKDNAVQVKIIGATRVRLQSRIRDLHHPPLPAETIPPKVPSDPTKAHE